MPAFFLAEGVYATGIWERNLLVNEYFLPTDDIILPTNLTNLHESRALRFNGDLFGRTNFH